LRRLVLRAVFLAAAVAIAAAGAAGQETQAPLSNEDFARLASSWNLSLDGIELEIAERTPNLETLSELRKEVDRVLQEAAERKEVVDATIAQERRLLDSLGPAPAEGDAAEAPEIVAQRQELDKRVAAIEAHAKQIDLIVAQADELTSRLRAARGARMEQNLMARGPSVLASQTWVEGGAQALVFVRALAAAPADWIRSVEVDEQIGGGSYIAFAVLVLAAVLLGIWGRRRILSTYGRTPAEERPSYRRRLMAAIAEGLGRGLVPSLTAVSVYLAFLGFDVLVGELGEMVEAACLAIAVFSLATALTRAVLASRLPIWRVPPLNDALCAMASGRLTTLAAVVSVNFFIRFAEDGVETGEAFAALHALIGDSLAALIMFSLVASRLWRDGWVLPEAPAEGRDTAVPERRGPPRRWQLVRLILALIGLAVPVFALFRFYALAEYLALQMIATSGMVAGAMLLHGAAREASSLLIGEVDSATVRMTTGLGFSPQDAKLLQFWIHLVFDLLLIVAVIGLLLPIWGFGWGEAWAWLGKIFTGFSIGSMRISLTDILLGIGVFVLLLAAVRFAQRKLEERVLPNTRLDIGAQAALRSGVGYIGVTIAVLAAISTAGIDLSSLAIIAGALSVGIGFGLQNIVNNFVSGLILLVERPIKVGDWVVIGQKEGFVKRISVRATEITTWQRSSVIIPNSEILSNSITNWTHKDNLGRVEIKVGVAYGSDTQKVHDILLECADAQPKVSDWPKPYVMFQRFGDSALEFELRVYLANILDFVDVQNGLLFAIDKRFREEGIVIPFPQRDIHIRSGSEVRVESDGPRPTSVAREDMPDQADDPGAEPTGKE
jgi:potassium-dependent mechanosensitive channel